MNVTTLLQKARTSPFYRWVLNLSVARMIPFNKPHGFRILEINDNRIRIGIPYRRSNFNHIRGLHACALATLSEFATGFLLFTKLDTGRYRLIMQKLEMNYHYQGKMDAVAEFDANPEWLSEQILNPLKTRDVVSVVCEVKIHDVKGNHLTTGLVHWQIKNWEKVKTKS